MTIWSRLKKYLFEPTDVDKERVERWRDETDSSNNKLTIEDFDKPEEEVIQVTKHMSYKQKKKKKSKPVDYNF